MHINTQSDAEVARMAEELVLKIGLEVHGYNPQFLISRIIRDKVYDNRYWKETCFALNAETIVITQLAAKLVAQMLAHLTTRRSVCDSHYHFFCSFVS